MAHDQFGDETRMPLSGDGRFTRDVIDRAFTLLNDELRRQNRTATLGLCGGAVMTLVHEARISTEDIDAWMDDPELVKNAARTVGATLDLPRNWLNDAVREFIPADPLKFKPWKEWSHLTVMVAKPEIMLAMKLHAARLKDVEDLRFLMRHLRLGQDAGKAFALYQLFYGVPLDLEKQIRLRDLLGS